MHVLAVRQEREYHRAQQQRTDTNERQSAFQNPPDAMHDPTWYDRLREHWDKLRGVSPTAVLASGFANADPMILNSLMRGNYPAYAQSFGGSVTNITYQVEVGGVEVKNTNASPADIGKTVGEKTASSINDRATYVLRKSSAVGLYFKFKTIDCIRINFKNSVIKCIW